MGSLANCLKKMGLSQHEGAILRGKFDDLKGEGYEASVAAKEAVTEYLNDLLEQKADVEKQATTTPDSPNIDESSQALGNESQTNTPQFKRWFSKSKIVDGYGKPIVLYHGTVVNFAAFDMNKMAVDSDWGAGIYLTNEPKDGSVNYAGIGPDLTVKIERRTSQLVEDMADDLQYGTAAYKKAWDKARKKATKELVRHGGAMMPLYVKMENPFTLGGSNETYVTPAQLGRMLKKINSLDNVSVPEELMDFTYDGISATDLNRIVRDNEFYAEDDQGNMIGAGHIMRQLLQVAGFDGVIDRTVDRKFGSQKDAKRGRPMEGMNPDTVHYIVFNPTQVKSATGNKGTFNPAKAEIDESDTGLDSEAPPPYGKPMSKERTRFLIWENRRAIREKELKLEGLLGRSEKTINWDREWEADTRVRSIAQAKEEIEYFRGRLEQLKPPGAEVNESNDGLGPLTPAQETALGHVRNVHKKPTWKERKDAAFTNLGLRLNQAIVDQFAPIKDYGPMPYLLSRLSKGSDGAFEAFLTYGNLYLDKDGVTNARVGMPSFFKNMSALQGQHIRFLWWVAAHRAEQLTAEQREHLFGKTDITELKKLDEGTLPDGSSRAQAFRVALQQYNSMSRQILDIAEQSGIINKASRAIWEKEFYVPFYRALENDKADVGANIASGAGLVRQQAFRKLGGGKNKINEDLMANVLMNWSHLISASAKNRAANAIFKEAEAAGHVTRYPTKHKVPKDAVWAVENGDKVYYDVHDQHLLDAITGLNDQSVGGAAGEALAKMKHILTVGVTANPAFKVRNILRDSIQSIAISGIGLNVFSNVSQGVKELANKDSQVRASMLAGGGLIRFGSMLEGNRSRHVEKLVNAGVADQTILDTKEKVADFAQKMWDKYNDLGDISEGANRAALYMKMIKEGKSHAEASLAARDLLDFSKGGTSNAVRFLTQSVPFLNARIQGTYRVYQGAKEDPMRFWSSVMAVAVASAALMLAYQDDDDWKKREEWDRDNYWWFKDGGLAYRIPKPFEVGAIATLAERTLEYLIDDEMTGKRLAERFKFALANTFAANPTPQMFKPIVDVYSNVDSFTGRRIESFGMEQRPKSERANSTTSELAKGLGPVTGLFNVSPVQLDHLIRGWFGWIGASALVASDAVARPMLDRAERPSKKLDDLFLVGNFVKELPASQSRYVTQFYNQAEEIRQAYRSYKDKMDSGDKEGARQQLADQPEIKLHTKASGYEHQMSEINSAIRKIEANREMSADTKRTKINLFHSKRNAIAEKASRALAY